MNPATTTNGRVPYETSKTGVTACRPCFGAGDVRAGLFEVWRRFVPLHSSRQSLSWNGKFSFDESEELGFLAARILDDLFMPVPARYTGNDPYQRKDFLSSDWVDFGDLNRPDTWSDYRLLNELLKRFMRGVARDPKKLCVLREQLKDVDSRVQVRFVLNEIARLATSSTA